MATLLVTLVVMLFVALALSISVLAGRKPVTGSCGGVGKALGEPDYVCQICGGDEAKCAESKENPSAEKVADDLSYDASKKDQA
jgi:uncharacterized protein